MSGGRRKQGKRDMKDSEKAGSSRIFFHNLDLETTTQTFMLRARPSPLCDSASVTRSSPWSRLLDSLLGYATCRHMWTKRRIFIWICVRTQETKRDLRRKATSPKKRFQPRSRFVSCVHTQVHMNICLFVHICRHVAYPTLAIALQPRYSTESSQNTEIEFGGGVTIAKRS